MISAVVVGARAHPLSSCGWRSILTNLSSFWQSPHLGRCLYREVPITAAMSSYLTEFQNIDAHRVAQDCTTRPQCCTCGGDGGDRYAIWRGADGCKCEARVHVFISHVCVCDLQFKCSHQLWEYIIYNIIKCGGLIQEGRRLIK